MRQRNSSPTKIMVHVAQMLKVGRARAKARNGVLSRRPKPQTRPSASGRARMSRLESMLPMSVPTVPVTQVMAPKTSEVLAEDHGCAYPSDWRWMYVGVHCASAPAVNVTVV